MTTLLQPPDLDIRSAERLAALAIAWTSGPRDLARLDSQILALREERLLIETGGLPAQVCPELTNANASSNHTVLLESQALLVSFLARRINVLPERDAIEFHRLFLGELRAASAATTTLTFTVTPVVDNDVVIPAGTQVRTPDSAVTFATDEELIVPYPETEGSVAATRSLTGRVLLGTGTLTVLEDPVAFVSAVTNASPIDSGAEAETTEQALQRARNYQRRARRLVSAQDVEDFVLEEILAGNGIVKVFPFIKAGDFETNYAGHTTIVVMTLSGTAVSAEIKRAIADGLAQMIGSQFVYVLDPSFVTFNIEADIKVEGITPELAIKAAIERNLRDFYATRKGNFGRRILRSEIIALIEGTPGVDRIASDVDGPIVGAPAADIVIAPYELPALGTVTLTVVP